MRVRIIIAAAVAVLLVGGGLLARAWFADEKPDTQTFAGRYTSETELGVRNLTIVGGHVRVAYAFDVLFEHPTDTATLRCGLVDTSGQLDFFEGSRSNAPAGAWTHLEFASNYDLPELTLGIRCSPSVDGVMSVVFRDVTLTAEPVD